MTKYFQSFGIYYESIWSNVKHYQREILTCHKIYLIELHSELVDPGVPTPLCAKRGVGKKWKRFCCVAARRIIKKRAEN